jgi:hypothetical protein
MTILGNFEHGQMTFFKIQLLMTGDVNKEKIVFNFFIIVFDKENIVEHRRICPCTEIINAGVDVLAHFHRLK